MVSLILHVSSSAAHNQPTCLEPRLRFPDDSSLNTARRTRVRASRMNEETSIRNEICEIGRRIYARQFAAGNDGNISCRLSDDVVLCTPTLICKGYMQPEDLCTVDLAGNQLSGQRQRTSEILLHLEVYRKDPAVQAVVHCHPPHATAFAVARVDIPSGILPEVEVFLGVVPRAEYETPGSPGFAQTVRTFIGHANTVLLSNHGVVSWAPSLERGKTAGVVVQQRLTGTERRQQHNGV